MFSTTDSQIKDSFEFKTVLQTIQTIVWHRLF